MLPDQPGEHRPAYIVTCRDENAFLRGQSSRLADGTAVVSLLLAPGDDVESSVQGDVVGYEHLPTYPSEILANLRILHDAESDLPDIAATEPIPIDMLYHTDRAQRPMALR